MINNIIHAIISLQGDKFLCSVKCCHFQILIEFWLNQNTTPSISSNVLSHGKVKFIILILLLLQRCPLGILKLFYGTSCLNKID